MATMMMTMMMIITLITMILITTRLLRLSILTMTLSPYPHSVGRISPELWALSPATWRGGGTEREADLAWLQGYAAVLQTNSWQVKTTVGGR